MAVMGITAFKERFKDYDDCYTIIGGTACDILMAEEELDFRATKDIDMIILLEDRYREFAEVFGHLLKKVVIAVDGNGVIRLISIDLLSQEQAIQYR